MFASRRRSQVQLQPDWRRPRTVMRPSVGVTSCRTCERRCQPARSMAGVMNCVQMSASLRSGLGGILPAPKVALPASVPLLCDIGKPASPNRDGRKAARWADRMGKRRVG